MSETVAPVTTPAATPTATPVTTPVATTPNWYDGKATPEEVGLLQNKGWTHTDPAAIAVAATKAYREAEKFVGIPHDELLRLPKNPVAPEWAGVWERLGVPKEATGYDLSALKFSDGEALEPAAIQAIQAAALKAHVRASDIGEFASEFVKYLDAQDANETAETAAHLATERAALQQNWGTNFEVNKFVAAQGAKALGLDDQTITALETVAGYSKTMEALRRVGVLNKDDAYVAGSVPGSAGVMTREQGQARLASLKADAGWVDRLMKGDAQAVREFQAVSIVVAGSNQ